MQKTFWGELLKDKERGKSRPLGGGREGREWFKSLVCYLLSSAANESNYRFNLFHSGCKERVILINIKMFSIVLIFQMERKRRNMGWRRGKMGEMQKMMSQGAFLFNLNNPSPVAEQVYWIWTHLASRCSGNGPTRRSFQMLDPWPQIRPKRQLPPLPSCREELCPGLPRPGRGPASWRPSSAARTTSTEDSVWMSGTCCVLKEKKE